MRECCDVMRQVGDHALLWEVPDNRSVHEAARCVRNRFGDRLVDVVPGHQTLLVVWDEGVADAAALVAKLQALASDPSDFTLATTDIGDEPPAPVTVSVVYDGADLEAISAKLGLSRAAVVELHSGVEYTVAFTGFAPGFPYLIAAEPSRLLELPRLHTPRTAVPAGSVAVAAGYCGVYPRRSPGGWNLLGRTDAVLFDAAREPPALLEPGARVRFEPASA